MEFDPTISALHHRQTNLNASNEFGVPILFDDPLQHQRHQQPRQNNNRKFHRSIDLSNEGRKRPHSSSPQEQQQQQQQHKKPRRLSQEEFGGSIVKWEEDPAQRPVKLEEASFSVVDDRVEDADNDVIVEDYPRTTTRDGTEENPNVDNGNAPRRGSLAGGFVNQFDGGGGGVVCSMGSPSNGALVSAVGSPSSSSSNGAFLAEDSLKRFPNKLSALEGFSLPELAGQHPIASKIFKVIYM